MWYFLDPEFSKNPLLILLFVVSLSVVIFLRYAVASALYKFGVSYATSSKRNSCYKKRNQIIRELKWASLSSIVFAGICALSVIMYNHGWTKIYGDIDHHSIIYFILSPILLLAGYETYYYWLHRLMHHRSVYKIIHKVHHESIEPTVFSAFSFHPLEAFVQFIFFPIVILLIPLHLSAIAAVFSILTVSAMINHAGVEVYGNGWIIKHIIGSSHHDLHHREFKTNFGLNLTWWDNAMKTSSHNNKPQH